MNEVGPVGTVDSNLFEKTNVETWTEEQRHQFKIVWEAGKQFRTAVTEFCHPGVVATINTKIAESIFWAKDSIINRENV